MTSSFVSKIGVQLCSKVVSLFCHIVQQYIAVVPSIGTCDIFYNIEKGFDREPVDLKENFT